MKTRTLGLIAVVWLCVAPSFALAQFRFQHHFGDRNLGGDAWGQTALVDVDRDGDLDFVLGRRGGDVVWYEYHSPTGWTRHLLGHKSPSDVGGVALDVNGDQWPDFVTGGAWYENSDNPRRAPFKRHVFDKDLNAVHDIVVADLDGDQQADVLTMSDKNDLRWYRIPADPTQTWTAQTIGESVHSGISVGDLDGDGDVDVVRSNIWFENKERAQKWISHRMTDPWGGGSQSWQQNATQTRTADINGNGRLDVVITDGESSNARIAWLEAPSNLKIGQWQTHLLTRSDDRSLGALHSLDVADFSNDGRPDIFTVEMEHVAGDGPPRWFIWENLGGGRFRDHVILDANLGGHEAVVGDVDSDGDLDICSKLWRPARINGNAGRNHFDYLENLAN